MYPIKIDEKYDQNNLVNLGHIFTTLYLGNYISGDYRENVGSHPGVDIFPKNSGDNVLCVLKGKVSKVGEDNIYGKHIFIEHKNVKDPDDFSKTTTLHSCYLHLSETSVSESENITEGTIIGKTGNTGNSYGEHLHFQIDRDTAPYHSYWPYTSADTTLAGVSFIEGVNLGLGLNNAKKYTVNPLIYLDKLENNSKVQFFNDVDSSYKYYEYLNNLGNSGLINGNNGNFLGDTNITRAELLKMMFKINGKTLSDDDANYFNDLIVWHKKYVNTAVNLGLLTTTNQNFRPNDYITRIEVLKIILLYLKVDLSNLQHYDYDDISGVHWYTKYVNYCSVNNLIEEVDDSFYPNKYITRFEVIGILYKMKKL